MVKAQNWLNETLPNRESREKVRVLGTVRETNYYGGVISWGITGEEVKFQNTREKQDIHEADLTGELDFSNFTNRGS